MADESAVTTTRAALVVGKAGMGKSALLRAFAERCETHTQTSHDYWHTIHFDVINGEKPDVVAERFLAEVYESFRSVPLPSGPGDRKGLLALLSLFPVVGSLLASLVHEDKRDPWTRLTDLLESVSNVLGDNQRLVLFLDPDKYLHRGDVGVWNAIAKGLPPRVRLLIAQRPDDYLAGELEARLLFPRLALGTDDDELGELDAQSVIDWYLLEAADPDGPDDETPRRLQEVSRDWSDELMIGVAEAAVERYGGYPVAHDAVMRHFATEPEPPDDPVATLQQWPAELAALLDLLFDKLKQQGTLRLEAALLLAVFSISTPREVWAKALGITELALDADHLSDPKFLAFLSGATDERGPVYVPFHALFGERLVAHLDSFGDEAKRLVEQAWTAIEPALDVDRLAKSRPPEFEIMAALPVALRHGGNEAFLGVVDRVFWAKRCLGRLLSAASDMEYLLRVFPDDEHIRAAVLGNLGIVMYARGDLDGAEAMYRKSLAIFEKLGRLEGMASQYSNLGAVQQTRGDLDGAEAMYGKSLEIYENLGRLEGMASQYSNLGDVMVIRGNLDGPKGPEAMYRKSLAIYENLGRLEGMASQYGNLGNVMRIRGDLDGPGGAEAMLRKALEIDEKLGGLEGMANQYSNLGKVMHIRGDLDGPGGAEAMYRKSLEINKKLGRLEGMAENYGILGSLMQTRGNLGGPEGAEAMYRKALEIDEKLGLLEGMANQNANLGLVLEIRGDLDGAREIWTKSRDLYARLGAQHMVDQLKGWIDSLPE